MYRHVFDEAIGTPPPAALDIDRLIRQQRQRRALIQTGAVGGSAAAVLLAGALTWGASNPHTRPAVPAPAADQNAARLQAAARQALLAAVPGATIDPGSFEMLRDDGVLSPLTYTGVATISANGRTGRVSISVMRGRIVRQCATPSQCQPITGPHGETGNLITSTRAGVGVIGYDVALDRSMVDDTSVDIDVTGTRSDDGAIANVPLTADQVIQMAENQALHVAP